MNKSQEIILTGGYYGAMYSRDNPNGFRISKADHDDLFVPLKSELSEEEINIEFPAGESPQLSIDVTPSFWKKCHEFRSPEIGEWMKKRHENSWREGEPPKYIAKLSTAGTGAIKIKVLRKQ